ncbi:MAG: AAA family ATPase, partial [Gammaproteobacteria bacterium]|nr:AAA family ATPase [Gammaproteobacteria bacterium]
MAEQERRFLGLTHNPFDQQSDDFFELGERKTHLEQLQYLSQWSRRALLVTGPTGVGKTTLFRKLSASLEPKVQLARVNGMLVNTGREVLMTIARSYQLDAPNNADSQQLGDLITGYAERQESVERICVALVDDAEVLDPRAFDDLLELLAR